MNIEPQKESICFNFEKNGNKQIFFDKAKKSDIIRNNNSIFLHKILSVKNQSLLEYTLKKNKSEILNNFESSIKIKKENSPKGTIRNTHLKQTMSFHQIPLSNKLEDIKFNSPKNISNVDLFSPKIFSPKIIVNKNKNLGGFIKKENEKEISLNTTFFNKDNTNSGKIKNKKKIEKENQKENERPSLTFENNANPDISFSNLYTSNYLRKPVVIKFNNGFNANFMNNNNNSIHKYNSFNNINNNEQNMNISISSQEKENENKKYKERVKTDERIKPCNLYEENKLKTELFRSFEELERKSMQISKRKLKKKSTYNLPIPNFKKEINLADLKESFYILKSKAKKKNMTADKKCCFNKNRCPKNINVKKDKQNCSNSYRNNIINNIIENEKNDLQIKNENITFKYWQENTNNLYNNTNNSNIKEKNIDNNFNITYKTMETINFKNISNKKKERIFSEEKKTPKNYFIKKKNININLIEDHKSENIYNIPLNECELYNSNFNQNLEYNNNLIRKIDKNSFIRNRYSKKSNTYEDCRTINKNIKKDFNRTNKTPVVIKKFIEDYKINENLSALSYSQSESNLSSTGNKGKQIKVNKKNHSSQKKLPKSTNKNLPSILEDEEEKIKKEIKNNLKVLNGAEMMEKFIKSKNNNTLKEIFYLFIDYYNQNKNNNYSTLLTNISQISNITYVKKIISINKKPSKENFSKISIMKKNHFNVEKQKLLLLKRKELGFFEKYEHCKDFIDNFRTILLKYLLLKQKNNKE